MTQTFQLLADGDGYRAVGAGVRDQVSPPQDEIVPAPPGQSTPAGAGALVPGMTGGLSAALRGGQAGQSQSVADRAAAMAAGAGTTASGRADTAGAAPEGAAWLDLGDVGMAAWLQQAPLWQILALSVVLGALLSLTPCVLPMVPILLAVIAGPGGAV